MARSAVRSLMIVTVSFVALVAAMPPAVGRERTSGVARRAPRIVVSAHRVRVDQPFGISVVGVEPGALVQLNLTLVTGASRWQSQARFSADQWGRVRVERQAPLSGDYTGVDAMGLVWSAHPAGTVAIPADHRRWTDDVHLSASVNGQQFATADLLRFYLRPGGRSRDVRARGLVGTLFQPPGRSRHDRPAVIVFGGSEGGKTIPELLAALLASHGYEALALAYFGLPGLPTSLQSVRLEYFRKAISWLAKQPTVNPHRIAIMGASRGGELALLLGSRYRRLKAVVAVAPSSVVWSGLPDPFHAAWTVKGQPVPFLIPKISGTTTPLHWYLDAVTDPNRDQRTTIPVERINGPVLLLEGRDDKLWPSPQMAAMVVSRLHALHHPYIDRNFIYNDTGHVIGFPYEPTTTYTALGGTPAGTARANRDAWSRTLRFLQQGLATPDLHPR